MYLRKVQCAHTTLGYEADEMPHARSSRPHVTIRGNTKQYELRLSRELFLRLVTRPEDVQVLVGLLAASGYDACFGEAMEVMFLLVLVRLYTKRWS